VAACVGGSPAKLKLTENGLKKRMAKAARKAVD
jgi:hypothetical protein